MPTYKRNTKFWIIETLNLLAAPLVIFIFLIIVILHKRKSRKPY